MLRSALAFLSIALIAGILGFTGIAGAAVGIARIPVVVFAILFVVSLIVGWRRNWQNANHSRHSSILEKSDETEISKTDPR